MNFNRLLYRGIQKKFEKSQNTAMENTKQIAFIGWNEKPSCRLMKCSFVHHRYYMKRFFIMKIPSQFNSTAELQKKLAWCVQTPILFYAQTSANAVFPTLEIQQFHIYDSRKRWVILKNFQLNNKLVMSQFVWFYLQTCSKLMT